MTALKITPTLIAVAISFALAGCGQHVVGDTIALGYHVGDSCTSLSTQATCTANTTLGCAWLVPPCPTGGACPAGVCYALDPCLTIATSKACTATAQCAWSRAAALCPLGASCDDGGYCHARDSGTTCSCVTPLACPAGQPCPPPECDCSGGGSGGGTCSCATPACAPGQLCPPSVCSCQGGGGTGCVDTGTCVCNCPDCPPGAACPACACGCGSGGAVPAPSPINTTTVSNPEPADPCTAHTDQTSCSADTTDQCVWMSEEPPCAPNASSCPATTVCVHAVATQPGGPCACNCAVCSGGVACPCNCDCTGTGSVDGGTTCTPPPLPPSGTGPGTGPIACPAIACGNPCPSGYTTGADGCPTCTCK